MSGELGLRNTFRERVFEPLMAYRGTDAQGGREISLIDFMQTRALNESGEAVGLTNTSTGEPVDWVDIWNDLGMDPGAMTLGNLLSMSGDMKYLAPEIVRQYIFEGLVSDASYTDLIAGSENVGSMQITSPWIKTKDAEPNDTAEAETIAEAEIEWGHKTITLAKKAKALKVTDELVLSVPLPLLSYFLRDFGVMLSAGLYTQGVDTLINGDQADASDACAVVGVDNTTSKIQFKDFLRLWVRARRMFVRWESLIHNEETAYKLLQLDEFSKPQGLGGTVVNLQSRNRIIPSSMAQLISSSLDDDQAMLFDKSQGVVYLSFRGLLVEHERIIMRQINGTAASIIGGYATIKRNARVILDGDVAYAGNGFPSYMTPLV